MKWAASPTTYASVQLAIHASAAHPRRRDADLSATSPHSGRLSGGAELGSTTIELPSREDTFNRASLISCMRHSAFALPARGFCQRRPGNLAKSPSDEQRVRPCSMASAARWASGTSRLVIQDSPRNAPRWCGCSRPGTGIHAGAHDSHVSVSRHASRGAMAFRTTSGLVASRTNARSDGHGRPTRGVPLRRASSHDRARSCSGAERLAA